MTTDLRSPSGPVDLRLVVSDMDGTLLDGHGRIPDGFWPLLERLRTQGVLFVPASGRQYAALTREFGAETTGLAFIAENGGYVVRDGAELSATVMDPDAVRRIVTAVRDLDPARHDVGVVVCGKRSAYVERSDDAFLAEAGRYYAALTVVPDVLATDDDVLKVAIFDFDSAERTVPTLAPFEDIHQVVVSGPHWIDVMNPGVTKGAAVRQLQESMGITAAQTVVFGDYLNDLDMLDTGDFSFAVANAHPEIRARAAYDAPANTEHGVVTVLSRLLDAPGPSHATSVVAAPDDE